jgi:hypothetical protein
MSAWWIIDQKLKLLKHSEIARLGEEVVHDLEAVAVVEPEAAGVVAVGEAGGLEDCGAFGDDGVVGMELGVVAGVGDLPGWRWRSAKPPFCSGWGGGGLGLPGRHALIGSIRGRERSRPC